MRTSRMVIALLVGMAIPAAVTCVHVASARERNLGPNFATLFPKPTGHNGYEEFVLASDIATSNPAWQEMDRVMHDVPSPTLAAKRGVVSDPEVRRALALVRTGLGKPSQSPRKSPELDTLVPDVSLFRSLGRLQSFEMCVNFEEGRNEEGLTCFRNALRFGTQIQVGTIASAVVALYVDGIFIRQCARYVDQLSANDCKTLLRIVANRLHLPDPQFAVIAAERDMSIRTLLNHRLEAGLLLSKIVLPPNASMEEKDAYASVVRLVDTQPDRVPSVLDQATQQLAEYYDATITALHQPPWDRKYPELQVPSTPADGLVFAVAPRSYARIGYRYTVETALLHLLAARAAIRRFALEHQAHLPADLEALHLGALALDPFTGTLLTYVRHDDLSCQITSAGPPDLRRSGRAPTGNRVEISLTTAYPP